MGIIPEQQNTIKISGKVDHKIIRNMHKGCINEKKKCKGPSWTKGGAFHTGDGKELQIWKWLPQQRKINLVKEVEETDGRHNITRNSWKKMSTAICIQKRFFYS